MSWMEKLKETYDNCLECTEKSNGITLLPICHTTQNAQIEIVIDGSGQFKRARVIPKSEAITNIPCTEESGNRTGTKPTSHPLCDKLQYVAGDFIRFCSKVTSGFAKAPNKPHKIYLDLLAKWCDSPYRHSKVQAVHTYVCKASTIADLIEHEILPKDESGCLLKEWKNSDVEQPEIFGVMSNQNIPEEAFIRWKVEIPGDLQPELWNDKSIWKSWFDYYSSTIKSSGLCYVTGKLIPLARLHPAKLRHAADKAKIISTNDKAGFTFRGRFTDFPDNQACGIGFEITQKAHNALRWLIARQGYRHDTQAIVTWSVAGKSIPDPFADSYRLLFTEDEISKHFPVQPIDPLLNTDVAQDFALRLKRKIRGYKAELGDTADIVILALDSATPGRMSITYYRELTSSEFLDRVEAWHEECCWLQNYGKNTRFIGAPAPGDIAEVAYGRRLDNRLRNATIRQLLPCIIDAKPLSRQIVESCIRRASCRNGIEPWEWEKALGIACALYRKHTQKERNYQMSLEEDYNSRDYLYGRLLAIADRLEEVAIGISNENRATNAEKLMQRFADNPYSTWLTIEKALSPYKMRLKAQRPAFLTKINILMDKVMISFKIDEFTSSAKLTGEFLLGYHCQREALKTKVNKTESIEEINE